MTDRAQLEAQLLAKLLADIRDARALGYPATEFLRMLESGAVAACTKVIMASKLPSGFARLFELHALELTAEAATVAGPWRVLFPAEVIDAANERLRKFDRPDLMCP